MKSGFCIILFCVTFKPACLHGAVIVALNVSQYGIKLVYFNEWKQATNATEPSYRSDLWRGRPAHSNNVCFNCILYLSSSKTVTFNIIQHPTSSQSSISMETISGRHSA
ncbi:hypothetical protein NL108_015510 [Boleophthalmus pectinirostris]|nr:hypothetical protein NL108_015510 [Boleophthalmus pectinirostris]